ncbi:MAG: flavohemoprotein [Deltaproteobacteria bacterium]|nr:flavohemoprotein [Deltaproteobacteria bacterium]
MPLQIDLLRSSFEFVIEKAPDLTTRFYAILFARYPAVQPMFGRNTPRAQQEMLGQALGAVVEHLEDAPWLEATLKGMGAKHVGYGVTDGMYAMVGECLLAALADAAAESWTKELETAWADAYGAIAGLMQAGAAMAVAA